MLKSRYKNIFLFIVVFIGLSGCIHNDLPYPHIQQNIQVIKANGESRNALIDSVNLTATVYLNEWVNIEDVTFDEFQITSGGTADPDLSEGKYNLTKPLYVDISLYQTYQWTVKAQQEITRYFTIEGQIGESTIDPAGYRVIVNVPETANLSNLIVTSIKLGPERVSTYNPVITTGNSYDFTSPLVISVTYFDKTEEWTIYVQKVKANVSTTSVDAWSQVIWAYGSCPSDATGSFQYKKSTSNTWLNVDPSWVSQNGGSFSCYIPHLEPLTEYNVRSVSNGEYGNEVTVTTQETADIPDGTFDQWWLDGRVWNPWNEGGNRFWDTGNRGAATLGQSNVQPTDHTVTGHGQAAQLLTKWIVLKLAAGSIYTGSFKQVDGTNGILDFGRQWKLRPTKLRGYYQYQTAVIDRIGDSDLEYLKGRPDSCQIYVALTDWTAPYEIRTRPTSRQLFDPNADYIIAYGELTSGEFMNDYAPFEIELKYKNTWQVPTYLQITCAASKFGDFFTGGAGALLYVDEFSFDYDY